MQILYVTDGPCTGTARHRMLALRELGHVITTVECTHRLLRNRFVQVWNVRTGYRGFGWIARKCIAALPHSFIWDIAWVNGGSMLERHAILMLKSVARQVTNYNNDDPYGGSEYRKWRLFMKAIPEYDLCVVLRDINLVEAKQAGAIQVLRETMGYDLIAHRPRILTEADKQRFSSDVVFAGSWKRERGEIILGLIEKGLNIRVFGPGWHKDRFWSRIKRHVYNESLEDDDYVKAVQCAKVAICLVSEGNRDGYTQRSFEIPYIGTPMVAKRTTEHLAIFGENSGVSLWSDINECGNLCRHLLSEPQFAVECAQSARARVLASGAENRIVMSRIVMQALGDNDRLTVRCND